MELKQIEYFTQLARLQHMSQTADFLNISQPTLSKSIASLERDLGIPLFDRVGNRIRLNASGQQFYHFARQALEMLNAGTASAKQMIYEMSGNISIVALAFAPILLPCIYEYTQLNPLVNIQLLQHNHKMNTVGDAGDYDFVFGLSRGEVGRDQHEQFWVTQPLFSEDALLVVGPRHPMYQELPEDGATVELSRFAKARFITMRQDSNYVDYTYSFCQNSGFLPRTYFQTDDFVVKMSAIREGVAVAFLPESNLVEAGRLCPGLHSYYLQGCDTRRTVLMMRKKRSLLSEAAWDFWTFLLEHYHLPGDERD